MIILNKVIQIAGFQAPYGGSFLASLKSIDRKITEKGGEVIYIFPEGAKERSWCKDLQKSRRIYFIPLKAYSIKTVMKLKTIFRYEKPDIVHSHFDGYDLASYFAIHNKTKLIWHLHNDKNKKSIIKCMKYRYIYGVLSKKIKYICCAPHIEKFILDFGAKKENVFTVLNGIDDFKLEEQMKIATKYTNNKFDFEGIKLLMHAWDPHRKGLDTAIGACEILNRRGIKVRLYCTCVDEKKVKQYINNLGTRVFNNITLLLPTENICNYILKSDIFISPSRAEGSPYSIMEAVIAEKPVVATILPGVDWQKHLDSIWEINIGDKEQLANKIEEIINHRKLEMDKKLSQSRHIIKSEHTVEKWANEVIKIYQER